MARKSKYTPDQRAALIKARQKKQERYWENRAQSRVLAVDRQVDDIRKDSDRAYRNANNAVRSEIDKFYRDFATSAGISEADARQKLSRGELQNFQKELERKRKVIRDMIQKDPDNRKLQAYDTEFEKLSKVRELTRKEVLEANVTAEIVKLGATQQQQMATRTQNVINTALWMNSADLGMLGDVDAKLGVGHPEQVRRAAEENWQHGDFSDKIWDDKAKLIKEAREVIENGFARNKGAYDLAGDLVTRMNASHSNALRLARTEFNHLSNQAALAEYQAKGIKKYKFVAAIDSRTCDVCADLNGQVFDVADAKVGKNFPPMHPNCRSVTTPVIDWDDEDEWDYSNIELDDDELEKLGLTDEDVAEIDSKDTRSSDAPAPSLTVQQMNQAINDTQSVQRRAEQAEAVKQQGEAIEIKARHVNDDVGNIIDEIDSQEQLNAKLYAGDPITLPQAAIEAEYLDNVRTKILKAELEAEKIQARAAKLDESIPKPDPKRTAALEDEIDRRTDARKRRHDADLPNDKVIKQATPEPFEIQEPDASDAIAPRTAFGKWWLKVRDGVERAKERFNGWVRVFVRAEPYMPTSQIASKTLVEDGTVLKKIDHKKEYEAILQEMNQNEDFKTFILSSVETAGWDDGESKLIPRLEILKEAHSLYSGYLSNSENTSGLQLIFGHPNHDEFHSNCVKAFGSVANNEDFKDAGGAFGFSEKGEPILIVRSTITLDGLRHEFGHTIHSQYLDDDETKDPELIKAVKHTLKSIQMKFAPFGVDRQTVLTEPPKRGFELTLLKALSGKQRYKTIEDYGADVNQYAGLVTAFHNINAIVNNDKRCGIHFGTTDDTLDDPGWKELFANSATILLSGNKEAIKFFTTNYEPIAQYVQDRLNWSKGI